MGLNTADVTELNDHLTAAKRALRRVLASPQVLVAITSIESVERIFGPRIDHTGDAVPRAKGLLDAASKQLATVRQSEPGHAVGVDPIPPKREAQMPLLVRAAIEHIGKAIELLRSYV